ncbi:Vacuolar protein sorting-associated protein 41 [Elasticomyces elasticus]|nr:Vacuolar protein sorting-associated protein 41 [Elasticomyces elasticus]KAK3644864.1 Vacuolar protein sorting-associated protein 41 [Elasticomyces elasticus]KAK4923333.1 Vacuolar protein sorting-associated protein 41 [Elasticomyces elasticus]KAK5751143.1 Vacuolar protein sorting-associated protein 41 [Elasticomyces elasticus]
MSATDGHASQPSTPTVATKDEPAQNGKTEDAKLDGAGDEEEDEDDEEDEEPKLKYAKLTGSLPGVYRNGDSTSAFALAGDKMVLGTHSGSVHVLSLPSLQGLRSWRAHTATITSVSVSPTPPPPTIVRSEKGETSVLTAGGSPAPSIRRQPTQAQSIRQPPQAVPSTPSNLIYIATSSLDGHVCVSSLIDQKDVQLRNFARPVNAVGLSPDYRNDRSYLSGGLAGQLVLTVGGKAGVSEDANTNSGLAGASSGWLGTLTGGLAGGSAGKDTVLHSGEGSIATIKWSGSGKWVVWVNEEGIKIMRSHLRLDSEQAEDAWKRIAHASRPNKKNWAGMAAVWKARCEWVNEKTLEEDVVGAEESREPVGGAAKVNGNGTVKSTASVAKRVKRIEKLVVGWGDTAWLLHVHEGGTSHNGLRQVGSADIVHKLQFRDCIVSGISLYTPSLVAILAYRTRDDDDKLIDTPNDTPSKAGGRQRHRKTGLAPQLRLVNIKDGEEVDVDELSISRFETLSAQDYHLGTFYMPAPLPEKAVKDQGSGALRAVWEASGGGYAERLFTSGASVMSGGSSSAGDERGARASIASPKSSVQGVTATTPARKAIDAHPYMESAGLKLVIQSPYDCVLSIKRDLADHLEWLVEHEKYAEAWRLLDERPEILDTGDRQQNYNSNASQPGTPSQSNHNASLADFFADRSDTQSYTANGAPGYNAASQKEKRRIGELWLQQLTAALQWQEAGRVAGQVLGTSSRWEHWVMTFAQADRFNEVTPYIPSGSQTVLPSLVYELVLGHYIQADRKRLRDLLEVWDPVDLGYDVGSVVTAIEEKLKAGEVEDESTDWRILMEALAKLYLACGRSREALRCYVRTQNADAAMGLIKDGGLVEAIGEDIPGLLMLRVTREQMRSATLGELEEASTEALHLLVEEAHRGTIPPVTVIQQLERKGPPFQPFLFFYLRSLWNGPPEKDQQQTPRRGKYDRRVDEGHALVEDHADLAVRLFAAYDRTLLLTFLRASEVYSYERAAALCEQKHYIPELVYILSKTGQTKRALHLIIGELGDVKQAIEFAKANGELWDDLLEYSMDKPRFIKGLLEEVGTSFVEPVDIVRRIPEGLEIEGLREGIQKLVREYEIQYSISEGVARVLRGEVAVGMDTLRAGRRKAVRFEIVLDRHEPGDIDVAAKDVPTTVPEGQEVLPVAKRKVATKSVKPGHCVGCGDGFSEDEREPLLGFACGHVYHLSCLLRANPDTSDEDEIERLLSQWRTTGQDDSGYSGRSVGAKVAHAHVIKNAVQGGCQHCVVPDGA